MREPSDSSHHHCRHRSVFAHHTRKLRTGNYARSLAIALAVFMSIGLARGRMASPSAKLANAISSERLEDALRLFLEEWQFRHQSVNASSAVRDDDRDNEMQSDAPASERSREFTRDDHEQRVDINCTRCQKHGEARERRLAEIKAEILNKLGLKHAPNVTAKAVPMIPPLHHLLDRYGLNEADGSDELQQMAGDSPNGLMHSEHSDFEEFYMNTERSISFAQLRK